MNLDEIFGNKSEILKELMKKAVCESAAIVREKYKDRTVCGLSFEIDAAVSGAVREEDFFHRLIVYVMTTEYLAEKLENDLGNEWYYRGNVWGEYIPEITQTESSEALGKCLSENFMSFSEYEEIDDMLIIRRRMNRLEIKLCEVLGELVRDKFFDGTAVIPFMGEETDREKFTELFGIINGENFSEHREHLNDFI